VPSAPGMSPIPAPELIGTQARSARCPIAASFSWFSAVEEQPCMPTRPFDHFWRAIQSSVSCPSAVVPARKPNSPPTTHCPARSAGRRVVLREQRLEQAAESVKRRVRVGRADEQGRAPAARRGADHDRGEPHAVPHRQHEVVKAVPCRVRAERPGRGLERSGGQQVLSHGTDAIGHRRPRAGTAAPRPETGGTAPRAVLKVTGGVRVALDQRREAKVAGGPSVVSPEWRLVGVAGQPEVAVARLADS
jgi:hypothetical protein